MKKPKKDLISDSEFIKLSTPKKKHHYNLPSEVIPEDENSQAEKEVLYGMEYDIEEREMDEESSEESEGSEIPDEDLEYLRSESAHKEESI